MMDGINTFLKQGTKDKIDYDETIEALLELGRIAIEKKQFDEAKKYLKISKYIDENHYKYYYYQGVLAKNQGKNGKEYFEKSLSINPNYTPAQEELKI